MIDFLKKLLDKSEVRFIIVGLINTAVGTAIMFLAYNAFHLSYWLSSSLNYILASVLSYFLNKYFTFKSEGKSCIEVLKFALNIAICYLLAYSAAQPLVKQILSGSSRSIIDNISMLVGMVLFVVLNYLGQRFFVFKGSDKTN